MSASLSYSLRVPINDGHGGYMQISVDVPDLAALSDRDRAFLGAINGRFTDRLTELFAPAAEPVAPAPEPG